MWTSLEVDIVSTVSKLDMTTLQLIPSGFIDRHKVCV